MTIRGSLLIPVENQVRELDPKLLLACVAAKRGFTSILGSRREIHFNITSFPRGIYLSKSITAASDWMFRILHHLGHAIVAWDEEALVHLPPEIYYPRRLSPSAMQAVDRFFAWGQENADLWRQFPDLPEDASIHVSGNPRSDMLRPEMHAFYADEVRAIKARYGDFILVNTNFNHVNAFSPVQNLFQEPKAEGDIPRFGRAAKGMTRSYAEGLRDLKQAVFEDFLRFIPLLAQAFPHQNIVVRPHPTENPDVYRKIAANLPRVHVTNEGNVVPWLLATRAVIHNGCTTGVEAYILGLPAITYRAYVDERYDFGFYRLPNLLSHNCASPAELEQTLKAILEGRIGAADGRDRKQLVDHHLAGLDGPMACELIADVLEEIMDGRNELPRPPIRELWAGRIKTFARNRVKRFKARMPGSHNRPAFQRHRYPPRTLADIRQRVDSFQTLLGEDHDLQVEQIGGQFFKITP